MSKTPPKRGEQRPVQGSNRPRTGPPSRTGPPTRSNAARPRSVAPRRDPFPIIMGSVIGMVIVGLAIVAFLLLNKGSGTPIANNTTNPPAAGQPTVAQASGTGIVVAASTVIDGPGVPVADEGNSHVADGEALTYLSYPPSSGNHYNSPAAPGFYTDTVPEGAFVHSLEHGYIVMYYKTDVSDAVKQQLKEATTKLPLEKYGKVKLVVVPYDKGMTTPIALAAWDRLERLPEYNYDSVLAFYQAWVDKSPEDVP
jgi:Protein of unknown function (DUF3105)